MNQYDAEEMTGAIAVVGMACRFPGANDVKTFWQNLEAGIESITITESDEKNRIKAAGRLDNIEYFDADYFGYSPREAEIMDPQQRMMLECAVTALENAGYTAEKYAGRIGAYLGSAMSTYLLFNLLPRSDLLDSFGMIQISNGNDSISTPVSYKLNLTGPSIDISTTCSTSLVAVHQACRSLLGYECDMALAGGSSINVLQDEGYLYQEGSILSPDGHCRPFDKDAKGTVEGSGLGLVVLKRLEDAISEGDLVHAIIKGSSVNNDGADKMGYTAPSMSGQTKVIAEALDIANITADSISYVEAHGTGTVLGDPIEISALTNAYRLSTERKEYCAIGSVKSNIGHLNTASGIAGLIKTILSLKNKIIPPSLNYKTPNPQIHFGSSPFYVNTIKSDWIAGHHPRRAAVSSFGMGGTNVHMILEEAPFIPSVIPQANHSLLPISAKHPNALSELKLQLSEYLALNSSHNLNDIAYTLQVGRKEHPYRSFIVAEHIEEAALKYQQPTVDAKVDAESPAVVFMFPGQGSQYVGMAADLYQNQPSFKANFDSCCDYLLPLLDLDLRDIIFANDSRKAEATLQLNQTSLTQPALFAIEYSLAKLLQSLNVQPQAMIGHSVGEYVAACLANVMSLEAALKLIAKRGKLIQGLPRGKMLAVPLSVTELSEIEIMDCSIAAINTDNLCILSGNSESILKLEAVFLARGIETKLLHTSHAFHSSMLDPILDEFAACIDNIHLNTPTIPYISNLTGTWITEEEACDKSYWVEHLRHTVRFADGLKTLKAVNPNYILVEVGPGQALSDLSRAAMLKAIITLPHPKQITNSEKVFLDAIGKLWSQGVEIHWSGLHQQQTRKRVALPSYPFQRHYFWIDKISNVNTHQLPMTASSKQVITEWFYQLNWKKNRLPKSNTRKLDPDIQWIVFDNIYPQIENALIIQSGVLGNGELDSSLNLNSNVKAAKQINIIYPWQLLEDKQGFYRLLNLAQALIQHKLSQPIRIVILTKGAFKVIGTEDIQPELHMIQGLMRSLNQEYPNIKFCHLDALGDDIETVLAEFSHDLPNSIVAERYSLRWIQHVEPLKWVSDERSLLKAQGVYFITGGLGHLGLIIANAVAETYQANLVLVSRTPFPAEETWDDVSQHNDESVSDKIRQLKLIKAKGGSVLIVTADVSNAEQLKQAYDSAVSHYGAVNGIIHAAGNVNPSSFLSFDKMTISECEAHFLPKIAGLKALTNILAQRPHDFCCLFSSISSQLSGLGHAAYSSANLYMDAFAESHNGFINSTPLFSLNWDAWRHGKEQLDQFMAVNHEGELLAIMPEEGASAFIELMKHDLPHQVIISTTDYNQRLNHTKKLDVNRDSSANHPRPMLTSAYVAPHDEVEIELVSIWESLLGIQEVGIHDNFFELGGHSLLATQLASRIRSVFEVEFSLQDLFKSPTIASMATEVMSKKAEDIDQALLEEMLAEFNV